MAGHSSHGSHSSHSNHGNHTNHGNHSSHGNHGNHTNSGLSHTNSGVIINHTDRNTGVAINLTAPPPVIEVFKTSRTWIVPTGVTSVRVLVVAGGGGGGSNMGGGGGGGGVLENMAYGVTPGANMSVVVGAGGAGNPGNKDNSHTDRYGSNGGDSTFGSLTATGGGGGGGGDGSPEWDGRSGGCGGGASGYNGGGNGGSGITGQGYAGGNSGSSHYSGGGGGAGAVGASGNNTPHGGIGKASDILGTNYYWGGGGGGSAYSVSPGGNGGNGGGGGGAIGTTYGGAGINPGKGGGGGGINSHANKPGGPAGKNTGGGGGGGSHYNYGNKGGDGGSGIVVVSYNYPNSSDWTDWTAPTPGTFIENYNSVDTIVELREKIEFLQKEKGQNTKVENDYIVPDNTAINMTNAADSTMATNIEIGNVTYDTIQDGLDSIHTDIVGTSTGLIKKNPGDLIDSSYIESINTKINDIAALDVSTQHASHANTGSHSNHGNHGNHANAINHVNHTNHSSHANGLHNSTSDEKLKKNIEELNNALDIIMKLKPVTYEWKDQTIDKDIYYGFIAQDVEKVLPQWIPEYDGTKHIEPHNFEWESLIIKAIQEQQSILNNILKKL